MAEQAKTAQQVFNEAQKKGTDAYVALTNYINDPSTSSEQRQEGLKMHSLNPWAPSAAAAKRLMDMDAGKRLANDFISDGSLGRMQEGRSSEVGGLIAERRKSFESAPEGGLSSEEMQAYRDQAVGNINRTSETARRRLAGVQAQTGVTGATAATQQMSAINAGNTERTNFERDLFLKQREALQQDRAEQTQKLSALETSISAARANEEATVRFNLEQAAREKFGQLSTALSWAGLGASERGAQSAISSQIAAANASKPSSGGGLFG